MKKKVCSVSLAIMMLLFVGTIRAPALGGDELFGSQTTGIMEALPEDTSFRQEESMQTEPDPSFPEPFDDDSSSPDSSEIDSPATTSMEQLEDEQSITSEDLDNPEAASGPEKEIGNLAEEPKEEPESFELAEQAFDAAPRAAPYTPAYRDKIPLGPSILEYFDLGPGNSFIDPNHTNVAIITEDKPYQSGAIWSDTKLDLTEPFEMSMQLYLNTEQGRSLDILADGMTFTMHNDPRGFIARGQNGAGLNAYGQNALSRALSIEFDIYENEDVNHASHDPRIKHHCALVYPKTQIRPLDHLQVFAFDITEDKSWFPFDMTWEPLSGGRGILSWTFEGVTRSATIDANAVFQSTMVYWGFTGSTGNEYALLAAAITRLPQANHATIEKKVSEINGNPLSSNIVYPGDTIRYTIDTKIIEGTDLQIAIADTLASNLSYAGALTATVNGVQAEVATSNTANAYTFTISPYANAGDTVSVSFNAKVADTAPVGSILNYAEATNANPSSGPLNIRSNLVTLYVNESPDITAAKYADKAEVLPGETFQYTIAAIAEKDYARGYTISVNDTLPVGIEYVGDPLLDGEPNPLLQVSYDGQQDLRFTIDKTYTSRGDMAVIAFTARARGNATAGVKANQARVIFTDRNDYKDVQASTTVKLPAGTSTKQVTDTNGAGIPDNKVLRGDTVRYTINTLINQGNGLRLAVTDALSPHLEYKGNLSGAVNGMPATVQVQNTGTEYTFTINQTVGGDDHVQVSFDVMIRDSAPVGSIENTSTVKNVDQSVTGPLNITTNTVAVEVYAKAAFSFYKVDAQNTGRYLENAEFVLYTCTQAAPHTHVAAAKPGLTGCWEELPGQPVMSDQQGLVHFGELLSGEYRLVETKAPEGYQLPRGQWRLDVDAGQAQWKDCFTFTPVEGTAPDFIFVQEGPEYRFKLANQRNLTMPSVGGRGMLPFFLAGLLGLASVAIVYGKMMWRRFSSKR